MTYNEFFDNITTQGILPTLQSLAGSNPLAEIQLKRLERLSQDLKMGLVTLANASVERNRIAMGMLSLLEQEGRQESGEQEAIVKLSGILRDYLAVSGTEESASLDLARAEQEAVARKRALFFNELPEPDLSPVPNASLATPDEIRKMIATSQLEPAIRHTLTLVGGTALLPRVEEIGKQYKQLVKYKRLQIITYEMGSVEENNLAAALLEVLTIFARAPEKKDPGFWGSIKGWFK